MLAAMPLPLRLHLRWWHWVLLGAGFTLALVLAVLLALRSLGRSDYQRVVRELESQGRIATLDRFVAAAPTVDVAVQEAWERWAKHCPDYPVWTGKRSDDAAWLDLLMGEGPAPPPLLQALAERRLEMEPARVLLRKDRLILGSLGWIAQDFATWKSATPFSDSMIHTNLMTVRALGTWLQHEAATAVTPEQALGDLDRIHTALRRPGCLIDAMILIAFAALRDETYVHQALMNRLPTASRERWLAEEGDLTLAVAAGFAGEHAWFADAEVRWVDGMTLLESCVNERIIDVTAPFSSLSSSSGWEPRQLSTGPWYWSTAHHDAAIIAAFEAAVSARLRRESLGPLPEIAALSERWWGPGETSLRNLLSSAHVALDADAGHRMSRIAVRILAQSASAGLPADQDALAGFLGGTDLLSPGGDDLHLAYERLADDRFRLSVRPDSPLPDFGDATRMRERSRVFGTPPGTRSLVFRPHVEIRLPVRLRPAQPGSRIPERTGAGSPAAVHAPAEVGE